MDRSWRIAPRRRRGRGRREECGRAGEGGRAAHPSGRARVLGVQAGGSRRRAEAEDAGLGHERDRRVPRVGDGGERREAVAGGRSAHADPPRLPRHARPAAVAGRGRGLRRRQVARGVDEGRRRRARVAGVRRTVGAALDGSGPLRGLGRVRVRRRSPEHVSVSRLPDGGVQQGQAVRPVHQGAARRRRVHARGRRSDDCDRLPAARPVGGRHAAGRARRSRGRLDADVHRDDRELRAVPQPQVRPDPAEGLLPHPVDLRADARKLRIRWRRRRRPTPTARRRSASTACSGRFARRRRRSKRRTSR